MPAFERVYAQDLTATATTLARQDAALAAAIAVGDENARLDLLGKVGEAERMLNRLDDAVPHLRAALALAQMRGDLQREIANLIRLATALQYREEHGEAVALFRACLARIEATNERVREDFAYQHFGRCLAEMGEWEEVIGCFERALALRRAGGDALLIASTEHALSLARSLVRGV